VLVCAGAAGLSVAGEVDGPYRVLERIAIGGQEGGYDFLRVDEEARRLYVAHRSRVEVLSTATGKVFGQIRDTPGVHGIALAAEYKHGFTSNGADNTVTMFDLPTLRPLMVIRYTGLKPDAIEYDPETRHVYVVNGGATVLTTTPREIFASHDKGESWTGLGVGDQFPLPYCRSLAQKADDPDTLFVATGDGAVGTTGAIQRSTNGGKSWQMATLPVKPNSPIWAFATHPADPGLIVACSHYGELYKSDNAGDSWTKLPREFTEIRSLSWTPN